MGTLLPVSAVGRAPSEGVTATALLVAVEAVGPYVGHSLRYHLDLLVMLPDGSPHALRRTELVELAYVPLVAAGRPVEVRVMADDPDDLCIAWRY